MCQLHLRDKTLRHLGKSIYYLLVLLVRVVCVGNTKHVRFFRSSFLGFQKNSRKTKSSQIFIVTHRDRGGMCDSLSLFLSIYYICVHGNSIQMYVHILPFCETDSLIRAYLSLHQSVCVCISFTHAHTYVYCACVAAHEYEYKYHHRI